jgi:DNA modification methylase
MVAPMSNEKFVTKESIDRDLDPNSDIRDLILTLSYHLDNDTDYSNSSQMANNPSSEIYSQLSNDLQSARNLYDSLSEFFDNKEGKDAPPSIEEVRSIQGDIPSVEGRLCTVESADATQIRPSDAENIDDEEDQQISLGSNQVDLIVTSPPYWQKRNYGVEDQLGQESNPDDYIANLIEALNRWKEFLRPSASIFLNIGDTYRNKSLVGIPGEFARQAQKEGWIIRNHIIWAKNNGIPSPADDRLVPRHEHIYHLVQNEDDYYYDLFGYSQIYEDSSNPGDVWNMSHDRNTDQHLAPYPEELVQRAITLACPPAVCRDCGEPKNRILERPLKNLNEERPQARRALEKFDNSDLKDKHIEAIRSKGISDAGKAKEFQTGSEHNSEEVDELANEAKEVLGGYFREFTFPQPVTKEWQGCNCEADEQPGLVFDPFAGSGTTIKVAYKLGYHGFGTDLDTSNFQPPDAEDPEDK